MFAVKVNVDVSPALSRLNRLAANVADRVIARTVNEVAAKAKTRAAHEIRRDYNLNLDDIRPLLFLTRASLRGRRLSASVDVRDRKGRSLNMIRFVERSVTLAEAKKRRKRGTLDLLRVRIKRGGGMKILDRPKGAASAPFILTNRKTGGTFVAVRTASDRLAIEPVRTIGVPQMFSTKRLERSLSQAIFAEFQKSLDRNFAAAERGF